MARLHNAIISNVSLALFVPMCLNNSKSKSTEIVSFGLFFVETEVVHTIVLAVVVDGGIRLWN